MRTRRAFFTENGSPSPSFSAQKPDEERFHLLVAHGSRIGLHAAAAAVFDDEWEMLIRQSEGAQIFGNVEMTNQGFREADEIRSGGSGSFRPGIS